MKEYTGRSGQPVFAATIDIDPVIYVTIDAAKYYHKAMIFDLNKNVLEPLFTFDLSRKVFSILLEKIAKHADRYNKYRKMGI